MIKNSLKKFKIAIETMAVERVKSLHIMIGCYVYVLGGEGSNKTRGSYNFLPEVLSINLEVENWVFNA